MVRRTRKVEAWGVEAEPDRDWASWLVRVLLALYLLPALLVALIVGGLALLFEALARGLKGLGAIPNLLSHVRSAAPDERGSSQGWNLGGHSRSAAFGRSGHEAQPWR